MVLQKAANRGNLKHFHQINMRILPDMLALAVLYLFGLEFIYAFISIALSLTRSNI